MRAQKLGRRVALPGVGQQCCGRLRFVGVRYLLGPLLQLLDGHRVGAGGRGQRVVEPLVLMLILVYVSMRQ